MALLKKRNGISLAGITLWKSPRHDVKDLQGSS